MKAYIFLLEYNNYFDRTIKKAGDDLGHYLDMDCLSYVAEKVNFAPNDELEASIVINSDANCDYALVIDSEEYPARTAAIASRWFVTSHVRSRAGQWTYSLKRDVIADNYDAVKSAPCFVEKGVPPIGSPLAFNEEGLGFNQVKTGETLLKDASASPWIVGYVSKDAYVDPIELPAPSDIDYIEVAAKDIDS